MYVCMSVIGTARSYMTSK